MRVADKELQLPFAVSLLPNQPYQAVVGQCVSNCAPVDLRPINGKSKGLILIRNFELKEQVSITGMLQ
jgi:hypothetical protein